MQTRDTPGGGMEVLDADGVWRTLPHACLEFIRHHKPGDGFTDWEWHIGQVFSVGLFPRNGLRSSATPEEMEASDAEVMAFRDGMKARFPEQTKKWADYMGWKSPAPKE